MSAFCLCLSVSLALCVFISLALSLSVYVYLFLYVSLLLCFYMSPFFLSVFHRPYTHLQSLVPDAAAYKDGAPIIDQSLTLKLFASRRLPLAPAELGFSGWSLIVHQSIHRFSSHSSRRRLDIIHFSVASPPSLTIFLQRHRHRQRWRPILCQFFSCAASSWGPFYQPQQSSHSNR